MNFHKIKNSHDKHNMRRNETMKTNGLTLRSIMNAINEFFHLATGLPQHHGTPPIRNNGGHHRFHAHAPGDGRWHMKYHRSR
jgi:hypothetical protein